MSHQKSLAVPKTWPINRKENVWIARPKPGAHTYSESIPLLVILRNILKIVDNKKEAKFLIRQNLVKVNGRKIREINLPVGLFDVVFLDKEKKYYRIIFNRKKKLIPLEIESNEANLLPLKIKNKKIIRKGKFQYSFTNGWTFYLNNEKYSTKDTLFLDLNSNKIKEHIPFEKGNLSFILGGKHVGELATITEIYSKKVLLKNPEKEWTGLDNFVFVIGKKQPFVKVTEK